MKRLCVFYRLAWQWRGRPIEWIVCKECQKALCNNNRHTKKHMEIALNE